MSSIYYWKEMLPSNWEVVPLKAVASYCVSSVDKVVKEDELPVELCNYTDVYKNDFITNDLEYMKGSATEEEILKYKVEIGDVIITKDSESWDDIAIPALVKETKSNLVCGYHLSIIKAYADKILPSYLFYCLQSKDIRIQLELASTGVTRYGLPKDEIGRASLPLPDIDLQKKIANYIDKELTEISKLIEAKRNLLQTLTEKRQALITQAVTKGTNQKVKLKNSGIDWLGEIPEHWFMIRLKYLGDIFYGLSQPPKYIPEGTALIRATNVYRGTVKQEGLVYIDEAELETEKKVKLNVGDIIVVRSGAYTGDSAIITEEWENSIAGFDMIIRPNRKVIPKFLATILLSSYVLDNQLLPLRIRAAQPHLNSEELGSVIVLLPGLEEQQKILDFLNVEIGKIDMIVDATKKSIELLKERRSSIITAAVTGQIKIK